MALPFTRPRHIQASPPAWLGGSGSGRCRSGGGLLVVDVLGVLGGLGVRGGLVEPGDKRLGDDPVGAEHQLLHR